MKRTAFTFRREWKTMLAALPPEVRAEVIAAVVDYSLGDDVAELSSSAKSAFFMLKPYVDEEMKKAEKRREAGSKGGLVRSSNAKQCQAMLSNAKQCQAMLSNACGNEEIRPAARINTEFDESGNACAPEKQAQEEKNGKEETSFLSPTPPIYPKEEKEKKEEPPHVPQNSQAEADEAEKLTLVSSESELAPAPKKNPLDPASLPPGFVAFWNAYPSKRRADKRGCLRKWKDNGLEAQAADIVADVKKRASSDDWTREGFKFVPLSITYLNQTRWDCAEIPQTAAFGGKPDSPVVEKLSPDEICRRRREAYFAEERRRNMLIYGKEAYRDADDVDEFGETF